MEDGLYYIFELAIKDDIDILINLDKTDWRGYRIRVNHWFYYRFKSQSDFSQIITILRQEM